MNGAGKRNDVQPIHNLGIGRSYLDSSASGISAPYNRQHAPTSDTDDLNGNGISDWSEPTAGQTIGQNPTIAFTALPAEAPARPVETGTSRLQRLIDDDTERVAYQINEKRRKEEAAQDAALKRYHSAWQRYYNEYYRNYYIAALQEQKTKFQKEQAAVVDSREPDGTLSQAEVQDRIKAQITDTATAEAPRRARLRQKRWFWPVIAGLATILIILFLQYNGVIASWVMGFISPGASSTQTIIIGTGNNAPVSDSPRIIIPKINVNAPVIYGLTSLDESTVQTALQSGTVNYPVNGASAVPGQKGNTVILGHSSADAFAPGNYKFIFVQLNRLSRGDLFYLDYAGVRYTYRVTETKIINPDELGALDLGTDKPYATLVTCDPPGTVARRLLVIAEQVSPSPNNATAAKSTVAAKQPTSVAGKPKTLLERLFGGSK